MQSLIQSKDNEFKEKFQRKGKEVIKPLKMGNLLAKTNLKSKKLGDAGFIVIIKTMGM